MKRILVSVAVLFLLSASTIWALDLCPGEDTYPPGGNICGDTCECEGDFTGDGAVAADDTTDYLVDLGRNKFNNACTDIAPCNGDFNCDGAVAADDTTKYLEDLGRNKFNRPCPQDCQTGDWCGYTP